MLIPFSTLVSLCHNYEHDQSNQCDADHCQNQWSAATDAQGCRKRVVFVAQSEEQDEESSDEGKRPTDAIGGPN